MQFRMWAEMMARGSNSHPKMKIDEPPPPPPPSPPKLNVSKGWWGYACLVYRASSPEAIISHAHTCTKITAEMVETPVHREEKGHPRERQSE